MLMLTLTLTLRLCCCVLDCVGRLIVLSCEIMEVRLLGEIGILYHKRVGNVW
jgi:hypothetical protein